MKLLLIACACPNIAGKIFARFKKYEPEMS
jgi:hypothetical protein